MNYYQLKRFRMRNFDILVIFILFFLTSCNSGSTKSDTKSMVKTQKSYTFSLAQWSLHREIEPGKLDILISISSKFSSNLSFIGSYKLREDSLRT